MARKRKLFKSKEQRDAKDVAALLRDLADKIEAGEVVLKQGGQEATLEIPPRVDLKVKAKEKDKKKGTRVTLKLTLKWMKGDMENPTLTLA
jgi:amphi-Trp domain-containing protein